YIDAEGLEKPVIVGHSLGGLLAFSVAAAAPNAVSGVVSVDGVPFLPALLQPGASVESIRPQAEAMRDFLSSAGADQLAQQARSAGLATGAASLDLLARMAAKSDPEASAEAVYEVMTTDLRPEVAKIQAPALLIAAGAGAQTPEAREQLMERYESQIRPLPDHRVVLAEGARHFVMLDSPESFNDTLRSFLDGLPKPSPLPEAP
ncbi:MAG: alpha/beta hydrolase, partial [Acidobacteria bacterium]|nr:alpha/beta hydrolase [Acidobacteriota bacterium]